MAEIKLPHLAPIKFAKEIISTTNSSAEVEIEYEQLPSLAMLVEAAAQSCAALKTDKNEEAFLVSLKGIKLLQKPTKMRLRASINEEHRLDKMRYVSFEIFEDKSCIAEGTLVIALQ